MTADGYCSMQRKQRQTAKNKMMNGYEMTMQTQEQSKVGAFTLHPRVARLDKVMAYGA
jgi:hypothetical protein